MAEVIVKRKSGIPWWAWLIGLLILIPLLWFWLIRDDRRVEVATSRSAAPATTASAVPPAPVETTTPAAASPPAAAPASAAASGPGTAMNSPAPAAVITDAAIYADTADKVSLAGRQAALDAVKVVRIVGPKTFTIASGSDELLVVIDEGVDAAVGSQGRINVGATVNLAGTLERLVPQTVNDISQRRFRTLTELERDALVKKQVYLRAAQVKLVS